MYAPARQKQKETSMEPDSTVTVYFKVYVPLLRHNPFLIHESSSTKDLPIMEAFRGRGGGSFEPLILMT